MYLLNFFFTGNVLFFIEYLLVAIWIQNLFEMQNFHLNKIAFDNNY